MGINRIAEIAGAEDWGFDPWGTAMGLFFDVAAVMNAADVAGDATPALFAEWGYRPSPFVAVASLERMASRAADFAEGEWADDFSYGEVALAAAMQAGEISMADLAMAGRVLARYTSLLQAAGRDY